MHPLGDLNRRLQETSDRALASGALHPIATHHEIVDDQTGRFLIRVVENLKQKDAAKSQATAPDPFLPYEEALFVADASPTHVCLLNKFNVVDHHFLIVTREFVDQRSPLDLADFEALWDCLTVCDGLGFYNGGKRAGASQKHKHLQVVPLPLIPGGTGIPLADRIESKSNPLPFQHSLCWFPREARSARELARRSLEIYEQACEALCVDQYNVLVTRQWLLVVPRRAEKFDLISLNALAFAGAMLVRDDEQLKRLKTAGPMTALEHVTFPVNQQ